MSEELLEKVTCYLLRQKGNPCSAAWIANSLKEDKKKTSYQLRRLAKAGMIHSELRIEFDFEYTQHKNVALKRRRYYYWVKL